MAKVVWENEGNPLADGPHAGEIHAIADAEDGSEPSHFYGKTEREVANKVLEAQANANGHINSLRRANRPAPEPLAEPAKPQPTSLTADQRVRAANNITDPAKIVDTVKEVVESLIGAKLQRITETLTPDFAAQMRQLAMESAREFLNSHPEYYRSAYNNKLIEDYINSQRWKPNVAAWEAAYDALLGANLLQKAPAAGDPPANEPAPAEPGRRQRGQIASTGLRNTDTGGTPGGGSRKSKFRMRGGVVYEGDREIGGEEYQRRLNNDQAFVEAVNELQDELATA